MLIEFWAFECVNCRRSVHTPELPQERAIIAARAIGEMHAGEARAAEVEKTIEEQLAADAS